MPVSLSQWSGEQGFKSATKPYHAVKKNDEKIMLNLICENTFKNNVII